MFRGNFNPRELDGVIMDEDDMWNYGLMDFDGRPNRNNEALIDNWKIVGVVVPVDDLSGDVQMDFGHSVLSDVLTSSA